MNPVQVIFTTRWYAMTTRPEKYFDCERFVNDMYEKIIMVITLQKINILYGIVMNLKNFFKIFICWGFSFCSKFFYSYWDVTITGEGPQILTYAQVLLPFSSDTHICCWAISSEAVTSCFYDLGLSRLGFEHPAFRLRGQRSNSLRHCATARL